MPSFAVCSAVTVVVAVDVAVFAAVAVADDVVDHVVVAAVAAVAVVIISGVGCGPVPSVVSATTVLAVAIVCIRWLLLQ